MTFVRMKSHGLTRRESSIATIELTQNWFLSRVFQQMSLQVMRLTETPLALRPRTLPRLLSRMSQFMCFQSLFEISRELTSRPIADTELDVAVNALMSLKKS
jgi:hypothetical protein